MNTRLSIKEKFSHLSIVLFLISTIGVFAPSLIYLNNRGEFTFTYSELLVVIIPVAILFFVFFTLFIFLTSVKTNLYRKVLSVCFAIACLLWLQGNILNWNYGLLDGRDINWNEHIYKGLIDTFIWFSILVIALLKSSLTYRIASKVSWGFILLQLFATFYITYQHPVTDIPSFKKYQIDESTKFLFSKNQNVIILVLDSFQTDIFQEIINEAPAYKNIFSGFTYFRDALAGHPYTETSVSLMLTGKYYEGLYPFEHHNKIAYLGNSVPRVLKNNSFSVDVYPKIKRSIYYDKTIASNIIRKKSSPDHLKYELAYLYDISLFRIIPHFTKKYIYNNQNWLLKRYPNVISPFIIEEYSKKPETAEKNYIPWLSIFKDKNLREIEDINFVNAMLQRASTGETNFAFKYYHLGIPHWPLVINEKLEYEKMEINRHNFKRQSKAALKVTQMFINKLKEIGAYDQSLIFILGDHGAGMQKQVFEVQNGFYLPKSSQTISDPLLVNALPLLLVKSFSTKGEMKSSNAPVSLSDIPKTIFSELNIEVDVQGENMFKVRESNTRKRKYISYYTYDSKRDYYTGLQEYVVSGPSWLDQSWELTGRIFHLKERKIQTYKYGAIISFAIQGNATQYQTRGWSYPEAGFTWTIGERTELLLPVKDANSNLTLTADIVPFLVSGKINSQRVKLYINDRSVGEWNVDRSGQYKVEVPQGYLVDDSIRIVFELPDAASPSEMGISSDPRPLAISLKSMKLLKSP